MVIGNSYVDANIRPKVGLWDSDCGLQAASGESGLLGSHAKQQGRQEIAYGI